MVLDFGMNIQLSRDFDWHVRLFFIASLVCYALIFSKYVDKVKGKAMLRD
jgi:hypothetical protein